MTIKGIGGRARIIAANQKWRYVTFNFTPKEFAKFEKLRGKKSRVAFLLDLIEMYEDKK